MPRPNWNSGQVSQWGRDRVVPQGLYPAYNNAYFKIATDVGTNNQFEGVLNSMILVPFQVSATVTIKGIECRVTTAGGGSAVVRMGLYGAIDNGAPGQLIVDGGTVSATTLGVKAVVINETLTPGQYWVALVPQDWTTTRPNFWGRLDSANLNNIPISNLNNWQDFGNKGVGISGVSGALPSPAGTLATGGEGRRTPTFALQIAV